MRRVTSDDGQGETKERMKQEKDRKKSDINGESGIEAGGRVALQGVVNGKMIERRRKGKQDTGTDFSFFLLHQKITVLLLQSIKCELGGIWGSYP